MEIKIAKTMANRLFHLLTNHASDNDDNFDLNDFNQVERKTLQTAGLYPIQNGNKLTRFGYHLRSLFVICCFLVIILTLSASLAWETENLPEMVAILEYLGTMCALLIKSIMFIINRSQLIDIEKHLRDPISYKYYKIFGREGIDAIIKLCNFMAMILRVAIFFFCVLYGLVPVLQPHAPLPFPGWWPIDKEDYKFLILLIQSTAISVSAIINATFDLNAAFCISVGIGQFRLLKTCLTNIHYGKLMNDNVIYKDGIVEVEENGQIIKKITSDRLEDVVYLHKHVLTYIGMIENMFSYTIFVQFGASVLVICLSGFHSLVIEPGSKDFIILIFYFTCIMGQVVLYCWYGNEILTESSEITSACYMSNWYDGTQSEKKVLFLIMERSHRDVVMTAGKFFTLSLPTLIMIFKTAYSYFTVLQQYYNK